MRNRIKELRKALGLSQDEFGRQLGLTRGAITNLEYGKTEAKPLFVDLVCRTYSVNRDWLVDGIGAMFVPCTSAASGPSGSFYVSKTVLTARSALSASLSPE